jgi:polyferredoxin
MGEEQQNFFKEIRQKAEEYIRDRILLLKLQTAEKTARLASLLVTVILITLLGFFILFFLSIMAGLFFSDLTNSFYKGFGIVAAFYVLLFFLIIMLRKKVIGKVVAGIVIKIFFDEQKENDAKND